MTTKEWEQLHAVQDNPPWQERMQRKSWYFENSNWYAKYRVHIHEINGNPQQLMQMAEMQLFGEVGDEVQWSNDATLSELSVDGATLIPEFSPDVFDYQVELPQNTMNITINATANHENAAVDGTGTFLLILLNEAPKVTVVAEDGSTTNTYTIDYTILSENKKEPAVEGFNIYPNPSNGVLNINSKLQQNITYELFNLQGQLVTKGILTSTEHCLDLSHVQRGVFTIRVYTNQRIKNYKIILE